MAHSLRSLVGAGSVRTLQEKLESWHQDFEVNSFDENLDRYREILELNNKIQKQLFSILNETSKEGGPNACPETIRTRLLPQLGPCFSCAASGKLSLARDSIGSEMQLRELESSQASQLQELDKKLTSTQLRIDEMEEDLNASRAVVECPLKKFERLNDYDREIQMLKDEITILDAQKSVLQSRLARSRSPGRRSRTMSRSSRSLAVWTPGPSKQINASRRACLVARFGFIYAQERFDAESLLRTYISDVEMVQRIIYTAAVESFHAAKMAFWKFKMRARERMCLCRSGAEPLESTVLNYIICHKDQYDVHASVKEVIRSMNINPKISFPPEIDFIVLSTLIQELCTLAFSMQTLVPPLDVAFGIDGELFDETKYYRSSDSDFTAAFVAHHVWPPLIENGVVIVKGEVVTKRPSVLFRSRSFSPMRSRNRRC